MKNLIKDLVESYGPTGFETEVTNKIRTYIADKVDEMLCGRPRQSYCPQKGQRQEE